MNYLGKYKIPLLFGVLSLLLYAIFAYDLVRSDFIKLMSLVIGLFGLTYFLVEKKGWNFWLLAGLGITFRLIFLPTIPNLSQDFYRFLWDGRLTTQGLTPYLFTPEMFINELPSKEVMNAMTQEQWKSISMPQAQELYAGMGDLNGSHFSNYPPVNQLFFAIASLFTSKSILGSAIALRLLIILADLGILYFGKKLLEEFNMPAKNIFWYFLNPFIIIELTGNLHFEGVMLFFVVVSFYLLHRKKWAWAAVFWGISISVKLIPLLLLPIFFRYLVRRNIKIAPNIIKLIGFYGIVLLTVALTFAPFLNSEFISNFGATISLWFQNFEFNASIYYIIRWIGFQTIGWNIIASVGKVLPLVVIFILLIIAFFRKNETTPKLMAGMLFGITIYFLLSTTVHPWYITTPLILSLFTKYRFPVVWSAVVMLSYSAYGADGFSENLWLVAIEYLIVIGIMIWEIFKKPFGNLDSIKKPQTV